jgi:hypothetical protein
MKPKIIAGKRGHEAIQEAAEAAGLNLSNKGNGLCVKCGRPALEHCSTPEGLREFSISGMCEECFDAMFEEEETEAPTMSDGWENESLEDNVKRQRNEFERIRKELKAMGYPTIRACIEKAGGGPAELVMAMTCNSMMKALDMELELDCALNAVSGPFMVGFYMGMMVKKQ